MPGKHEGTMFETLEKQLKIPHNTVKKIEITLYPWSINEEVGMSLGCH